ncbi:hypothetical protein NDU88_000696 [Pleurodeles waltl]|uniref:Uncharacterized protein n=1 Tax=Pleurodeles waltl TaxID=8319 RepID=A0AAV7LXL9_PLEWA|nr:hypothetical protein NDU88_000696 [Pleurodeles waltl]
MYLLWPSELDRILLQHPDLGSRTLLKILDEVTEVEVMLTCGHQMLTSAPDVATIEINSTLHVAFTGRLTTPSVDFIPGLKPSDEGSVGECNNADEASMRGHDVPNKASAGGHITTDEASAGGRHTPDEASVGRPGTEDDSSAGGLVLILLVVIIGTYW